MSEKSKISDFGVFEHWYTKNILRDVSKEDFNKAMECLVEHENIHKIDYKIINLVQAVVYVKSVCDKITNETKRRDKLKYEIENVDKVLYNEHNPDNKQNFVNHHENEIRGITYWNSELRKLVYKIREYIDDLNDGKMKEPLFNTFSLVFYSN